MIRTYHDLKVYRLGYDLGREIHQLTRRFPKSEQYEMASQLRRASLSIPLNIAEGYGKKQSAADFKRFLLISLGSCNEVQVLLDFAKDFDYLNEAEHQKLWGSYDQLGKQISVLHSRWS